MKTRKSINDSRNIVLFNPGVCVKEGVNNLVRVVSASSACVSGPHVFSCVARVYCVFRCAMFRV